MRLTKLSLGNFKSFSKVQHIDLAPVTMLFGPNSVGKSSVILSLFYLRQILSSGNCDPLSIQGMGSEQIGGFQSMVHMRDLKSSIFVGLEFETEGKIGSTYTQTVDLLGEKSDFQLSGASSQAEKIRLEFEISWTKVLRTAYVSRLMIVLDDQDLAEIVCDDGLKQAQIKAINYLHPLLLPEDHDDWLVMQFEQGGPIHSDVFEKTLELMGIEVPDHRDLSKGADNPLDEILYSEDSEIYVSDDCYVSTFHELLNDARIPANSIDNSAFMSSIGGGSGTLLHAPIFFDGKNGGFPQLGSRLVTSIEFDDPQIDLMVHEILSDAIVAPLDNLLEILEGSLCIGPIRMIPDSEFQSNPSPKNEDWHSGRTAWDLLSQGNVSLLRDVSTWMSDEDRLNLGYGISLKVEKRIAEFKHASGKWNYEDLDDQLDSVLKSGTDNFSVKYEFDRVTTKYGYEIWDSNNHMEVSPREIGVGISQLLPLVVAACSTSKGLIAIEQPELHVHPRIQVAIGDLLTQVESSSNFLVETHSEHLILRILKRIRQTTDGELPEGVSPVKPSDISVTYLAASEGGVEVRKIEIDEDGDFVERWPDGFFAERRKEFI